MQSMSLPAQPRRKTSSSSNSSLLARHRSWELPTTSKDATVFDEEYDAMDMDDASPPYHALNHPLREMAERTGKEIEIFAEQFDKYVKRAQNHPNNKTNDLVSLIDSFKKCTEANVATLRRKYHAGLCEKFQSNWSRRGRSQDDLNMDSDYQSGIDDLDRWHKELQTWKLFQSMLECDYSSLTFEDNKASSKPSDRFEADGSSWRLFIQGNETAMERLKVLQWLEYAAEQTESDLELIETSMTSNSSLGSALLAGDWMDTQEKIKAEKRLRLWDTSDKSKLPTIKTSDNHGLLVTQLDPDCVMRQDRNLETADEQFERAFWELCWEMLRRGSSMEQIYHWCADRHSFARAISIGARPTASEKSTPASRFLWRQACAIASQNSFSEFENAVYGLLAGQAEVSQSICRDWADSLFVVYNNKLIQQYVTHLETQGLVDTSKRKWSSFKLSSDTERIESAQLISRSLESDPVSQVNSDVPFQLVQAALISHEFMDLIRLQGIALARSKEPLIADLIQPEPATELDQDVPIDFISDQPDTLRVLTHMYLIYLELGVDIGDGLDLIAAENVLCGYLRFLLFAGKRDPIPLYASKLSSKTCVDVLARVLPSIANEQEQMNFVRLMKEANVNVPEIFTHQVNLTMQFSPSIAASSGIKHKDIQLTEATTEYYWPGFRIRLETPERMKESDVVVIRALQWFLYIEGCWARTFESLTRVAIGFLRSGSLQLAECLFETLSFATVSKAKTPSAMNPVIDVNDESEEDLEPSDSENEDKISQYQLSPRKEPTVNRSFGEPTRVENLEKAKVQRDLYKAHATTYFELGQLVAAIQALYTWREVEDEALETRKRTQNNPQAWSDCKRKCKQSIDQLVSSMEPLLHSFLSNPAPSVERPEVLTEIRQMYLPQMMLAYTSALQAAGYILTRDHLLQSLDLATDIADNDVLIEDIKSQGLMGSLVNAFARASKSLLHLKETNSNSKRKETSASTIWEDLG